MKKILIVIPSFHHGGTNRSLWNFLNTKRGDGYEVHIMAMQHEGAYKERMKAFHVLPESLALSALLTSSEKLFSKGIWRGVGNLIWKIRFKTVLKGDRSKLYRNVSKRIKEDYDMVVSFQEGAATELASLLPAKRRAAWVRCDYSNYLRLAKKTDESEIYERFDRIVCVSQYTAEVFAEHYPQFSDRVSAIYNIIDTEGIMKAAKQDVDDKRFLTDVFTVVSIGRMDVVKRFSYIPAIAKKLKESGSSFRWYIIGDGGTEKRTVEDEITKCGVENEVILLGAKENPYPYVANSDLLVCPSITEACPNVVNEAKILHIPVVAADFPSAPEYIRSGENGIISTMEQMADTLISLSTDREVYSKIKDGISSFIYENEGIAKQLDMLFSGNVKEKSEEEKS